MSFTADDRAGKFPRIFSDALALPLEGRAAFLDAACGEDPALRADVESLLAAHAAAGEFFGRESSFPMPDEILNVLAGDAIGSEVGPYRITRLIATGGMGAVFLGERTDEAFRKQVAVKLIRGGLWGTEAVERFKTERQVLADLEHPGIAHLIDGGSTAAGLPFLVMEYVDGGPITRHCTERSLDVAARLRLFLEVCDAVRYAHQNLVIHRDLKPSNILVDRSGRVKLLDFGIAKVIGEPRAGEAFDQTRTSLHPLTPRYASPEQIAGRRMTTSTDIYSLGVVLYELLTGGFPYDIDGKSPSEVAETIASTGPTRPSRRANGGLARRLSGDLDTIVLKALHKEPERRYLTVEELAADIRRHLTGLPVHARPDTVTYRVSKFVRRNKALVGGTAGLVAVLATALVVTLQAYHEATRSKSEAEEQTYVASLAAAEASIVTDKIADATVHLDAAPMRLRGWEWRHLHARLDRSLTTFQAHSQGVTRIVFAPDETRFLTASIDSVVKIWRGPGDMERSYGPFTSGVESAAFVPGSDLLALGLNDGSVLLVTRSDGSSRILVPPGKIWALVSVSPDGSRLACGFLDGFVHVWTLPTGTPIAAWQAHASLALPAYSPDGRVLATGGADGHTNLYDAYTHRLTHEFREHAGRVYTMAWSPDGARLVTGSMDRTAKVWDIRAGGLLSTFREHGGTACAVAFNPRGDLVMSSGSDHRLLVWDAATGASVAAFRGHLPDVTAIAPTRDGARILSGDFGGTIKLWEWNTEDVPTIRYVRARAVVPTFNHAALDPQKMTLACAWNSLGIPITRVGTQSPQRFLQGGPTRRVAFTPDGSRLVAGCESGAVLVFETADSVASRTVLGHRGPVLGLAVEPSGTRVATSSIDGLVKLWALPEMDSIRTFVGHSGAVLDVEFSPAGDLVASCGGDGTIRIWETSGPPRQVLRASEKSVNDVAFDPRGLRIAAAASDGSVQVWDLATSSSQTLRRRGLTGMIAVAWSRDGTRLAAGGKDDVVRLFDVALGREVVGLHGHVGRVTSLFFTPEDAALVSTSNDGTVKTWEATTSASRRALANPH